MPRSLPVRACVVSFALLALGTGLVLPTSNSASAASDLPAATPSAACDRTSRPETAMQGHVPTSDIESGRIEQGYYCNASVVGHLPSAGGYRVERYTDRTGRTCAYYDASVVPVVHPLPLGVHVVDMTDPARPKAVRTLRTPGMASPHESLRLNQTRGLLAAVTGFSGFRAPGTLDVYSVAEDCTAPKLMASAALGLLGHESGFAPDGKTFWVSDNGQSLSAVDLSDPARPTVIYRTLDWITHGLSVSEDGNTLYLSGGPNNAGFTALDATEVQQRKPSPQVKLLSQITWPEKSIPQNATPFESGGHKYVLETDELGGNNGPRGAAQLPGGPIGAARIIDVDDITNPKVVSHLRLAVNNTGDGTYAAHYCSLPSRIDPAIIACGFVGSGLRVFDVRNPLEPREVAYANTTDLAPGLAVLPNATTEDRLGQVYSAPAYDPARQEIWFTDAARGLIVVRLSKGTGIQRFARVYRTPGN